MELDPSRSTRSPPPKPPSLRRRLAVRRAPVTDDLVYFTHEIRARQYGGWYRRVSRRSIEVLFRGHERKTTLKGLRPEDRARQVLESMVAQTFHEMMVRSRRLYREVNQRCARLSALNDRLDATVRRAHALNKADERTESRSRKPRRTSLKPRRDH
jgi:hypothetical protein